jgi:Big-like domain-containing protein/List-Bact-rpt repeat protein
MNKSILRAAAIGAATLTTLAIAASPAFAITRSATLNVTKTGNGYVSSDDGHIDCGSVCSHQYSWNCTIDPITHEVDCTGPTITLTATSANGYTFASWTGCDSSTGNSCEVSLNAAGDTDSNVNAVFHDSQAPSVSLGSPTAGAYVRGTTSLGATATDNSGAIAKVEFYVRGVLVATDTSAPYSASFDTTTFADGPATVLARSYDAAANAADSSATVTIDNTKPTFTQATGPNGGTFGPGSTESFSWAVSDATAGLQSVTCKLDTNDATACASQTGQSYTGLGGGAHTLLVTATDKAGNHQAISYSWSIDATAPELSAISGAASGPYGPRSHLELTWAANDPESGIASVTCSLDGAPAGPCTSANEQDYADLPGGEHTLVVTATNGVGTQTSKQVSWTVDATAPKITVASIRFGQTIGSVRKHGLKATAILSEAGTLKGALLVSHQIANHLHIPKAIGHGSATLADAWPANLTVKLSDKASNALGSVKKLPVALKLTAKDAAGNRAKPKVLQVTLKK